ncbi:MAG TPA: DUF3224 domain-containing protein [Rudaea sp.]
MTQHATGPFEVKIGPLEPYNSDPEAGLGRMSIDKQFHGTLEATSKGEMLCTAYKPGGSAGYVALERVSGTLAGRRGTFVLQHSSLMMRGAAEQNIFVVPDSGTGELEGLSGRMTIDIAQGGAHSYRFDYSFASA